MTRAITIRPARRTDIPALATLARAFAGSGLYPRLGTVGMPTFERILDDLFALGDQACLVVAEQAQAVVGAIALVSGPHPITGEPYADEVCWWVDPAYRAGPAALRLLQAAEAWACAQHLALIKMIAPAGSRVGRFYERRGYVPVETAYMKELH